MARTHLRWLARLTLGSTDGLLHKARLRLSMLVFISVSYECAKGIVRLSLFGCKHNHTAAQLKYSLGQYRINRVRHVCVRVLVESAQSTVD